MSSSPKHTPDLSPFSDGKPQIPDKNPEPLDSLKGGNCLPEDVMEMPELKEAAAKQGNKKPA